MIHGSNGGDFINGNSGTDRIYGHAGDDVLYAGSGWYDELYGGDGNDELHGNNPSDDHAVFRGEAGQDTFYVDSGKKSIFVSYVPPLDLGLELDEIIYEGGVI